MGGTVNLWGGRGLREVSFTTFLPEERSPFYGGTDGADYASAAVYAIDDDNPYAERLFGDAPATIEQMIAETAVKYASHPALAKAGINAVEFRCWFPERPTLSPPISRSRKSAPSKSTSANPTSPAAPASLLATGRPERVATRTATCSEHRRLVIF